MLAHGEPLKVCFYLGLKISQRIIQSFLAFACKLTFTRKRIHRLPMNQDEYRICERKEKGERKTMHGLGTVNLGLLILGKLIFWQLDTSSDRPSDLEKTNWAKMQSFDFFMDVVKALKSFSDTHVGHTCGWLLLWNVSIISISPFLRP